MEDRVAIFIDGSNLYHSVKNNFGRHDLNFTEFANKLSAGRRLFRVYYYNILQEPSQYPDSYREQPVSPQFAQFNPMVWLGFCNTVNHLWNYPRPRLERSALTICFAAVDLLFCFHEFCHDLGHPARNIRRKVKMEQVGPHRGIL